MTYLEPKLMGKFINMLSERSLPKNWVEDILQEFWVRLYKSIIERKYNPKKGSISTYSFHVMSSTFYDYLRKNLRHKVSPLEYLNEDGNWIERKEVFYEYNYMRSIMNDFFCQKVFEAIEMLPQNLKNFIILRYIAGLKLKEIAQINNITVSALRSHISRAARKLLNLSLIHI